MIPFVMTALGWVRGRGLRLLFLLLIGGVLGGAAAWAMRGTETARLRVELAEVRLDLAEGRYGALQEVHARAERAWTEVFGRLTVAAEALAQRSRGIAAEERALKKLQEEISNEPEFACRRRPLPAAYLERLRRPGPAMPAAAPGGSAAIPPPP